MKKSDGDFFYLNPKRFHNDHFGIETVLVGNLILNTILKTHYIRYFRIGFISIRNSTPHDNAYNARLK